ncbi:MAG: hypothetical protein ACP5QO_07600 [Clostridia bacterium]
MARILLYGVGDLGEKAAYLLAAFLPPAHELVLAGRDSRAVAEVAVMARMVTRARPAAPRIESRIFPLHPDAVCGALAALKPDVFLFMATQYSWRRVQELPAAAREALDGAGFAVWLPCQAALPLSLLPVLTSLDSPPWLMLAPYPDAVAPMLARQGYDRVLGFGNVDELVMGLEGPDTRPGDISLVAHHSVEAALFDGRPLPPYRLSVRSAHGSVAGELSRPFLWPSGTRSHMFTGASLVRTLTALLDEDMHRVHIPGPRGLPGGYPCRAGRSEIAVCLPSDLSLAEAVAINEAAARADGIEAMDRDGTVHLTTRAREALRAGLRLEVENWSPPSMEAAARILLQRVHEMSERERR